MRAAIISDIHDNLVNLEKCLNWIKDSGIEALFCCGDVTSQETLSIISQKFSGRIYLVKGNIDFWEDDLLEKFDNIKYLGSRGGAFEFAGKKIGLCHEPFLIDDLISREQPELIFYGHTHRPWREERSGVLCFNPGTLGGVFQKATFAFYDTAAAEPELKILETF